MLFALNDVFKKGTQTAVKYIPFDGSEFFFNKIELLDEQFYIEICTTKTFKTLFDSIFNIFLFGLSFQSFLEYTTNVFLFCRGLYLAI